MTFELQHTDNASDARTGLITTAHGQIKTPIFMPVGTVGSVKGVHFEELRIPVNENTWNPPESVRIGRSQPLKPCKPPAAFNTSKPGRR